MRKILIVEDDEKLCRELGTFLTNNGYQAESLPEGEYTVKAILEAQPDLVLLDLGLPGTDGLYLCRELRKVCELPVIVITSQDTRWRSLKRLCTAMKNGVSLFGIRFCPTSDTLYGIKRA